MKNKKTVIAILSVIAVFLVVVGLTYAYWLLTRTQKTESEIASACIKIAMSGEKNDINLTEQFPIDDETGMALIPYEFTVTNNCKQSIDYQVALEAIGKESESVSADAIKVAIGDKVSLLSSNPIVDTTINGAYKSYKLKMGTLKSTGTPGASATYSVRIWIDKDASISEMNKTFKSKISVTAGQGIITPYSEIYEKGTLAYNVLVNNGDVSIETINPEKFSDVKFEETTPAGGSTNCYWGTEYSFDQEAGGYKLGGTLEKATTAQCISGEKSCGKYTLYGSDANYTADQLFEIINFQPDESNKIHRYRIKHLNAFDEGAQLSSDVSEIYKTTDDLGDSYYFRGAPTNNYVEFGTYKEDTTLTLNDYDNPILEDGWFEGYNKKR